MKERKKKEREREREKREKKEKIINKIIKQNNIKINK